MIPTNNKIYVQYETQEYIDNTTKEVVDIILLRCFYQNVNGKVRMIRDYQLSLETDGLIDPTTYEWRK